VFFPFQAAEELPAVVPAAEVPQASAPASAAVAAAPKPSGGGGKPAGRVGKHIGAPVAKSRVQVNRRKGTLQRALAYVQQQLPKSWMHRWRFHLLRHLCSNLGFVPKNMMVRRISLVAKEHRQQPEKEDVGAVRAQFMG
jgi:hypothetical protein